MNIRVEKINPENRHIHREMWGKRVNTPCFPDEYLPDIGWISFNEEVPICSAYYFSKESCKCAWLTFFVFNKEVTTKEREEGFKKMMECVEKYSKDNGIVMVYSSTNSVSLMKRLMLNGYILGDVDIIEMGKLIT